MELMKLLLHGDCLEKLKLLKENSIDSIVTDPPYGLSFMNKKWDYDVPSTEIWTECLRVLKPGGHLLSFGGSRTYHRMAVRIEDAGFEIRDQIMWIYGSGFPKSHNIGKAVDKLLGNEREVVGEVTTQFKIDNYEQNIYGKYNPIMNEKGYRVQEVTKGNSVGEGWGTALKPAHEPIVVARKPLSEKTVAENVIRWGTGGLNIDVSRVGTTDNLNGGAYSKGEYNTDGKVLELGLKRQEGQYEQPEGRWPANIILDEEAGQVLDEQSGISKSTPNHNYKHSNTETDSNTFTNRGTYTPREDKGGASRFFYCAKTSKKDRDEGCDELELKQRPGQTDKGNYSSSVYCKDCGKTYNGTNDHSKCNDEVEYKPSTTTTKNHHPTVKPTSLMEYLIKLVTPVKGTVLDPFMGSGSTGKASVRNGFDFIGIEREEEYIKIAEARIKNELNG